MTRAFLLGSLLLVATAAEAAAARQSPIRVAEILCDGRRDPVGVDPAAVRFSWVMESEARGQSQRAWRIAVASSREALLAGKADVWDSGRVASTESLLVRYGERRSSRPAGTGGGSRSRTRGGAPPTGARPAGS